MFPVYKDSRTIKKMVNEGLEVLKKYSKKNEIIIVDDGCPEHTGRIAQKFFKNKKNIKVFFHKKNLGYGAALKTGLKKCNYDWIFQIDGDAEYSVFDLKKFLAVIDKSDLIISFRKKKKYKTIRIFISWVYNISLRFLFKTKFLDISTGSRLIKKNILKKIKIISNSPFIGAEIAIKAHNLNFRIKEIGIDTFPRNFGSGSSVKLTNILLTIIDMIKLYINLKKKSYG